MLKLRDARTGELSQALPAGRRQLRILVAAPGQLRAYLTADLLRRAAEVTGLLPLVTELLPTSATAGALGNACSALNIHPPRDTLTTPVDPLAGILLFDVGIRPANMVMSRDGTELARLWIEVGSHNQVSDLGDDPLAVRLALMRHRHAEAVPHAGEHGSAGQDNRAGEHISADGPDSVSERDSADGAGSAGEAVALARWRALVAQWARSPSGAISRECNDAITQAFATDLDTATALRALTRLADDPDVPDGVKFETFAAADRLLGLDLARDIGK